MKKLILTSVLGILLTAAIGCQSNLKRADKLLKKGHASSAMVVYEDILLENPENDDAKIGLSKARLKWIDAGLLQVRLLRLGQNYESSEDLLIDIIEKQRQWRVLPSGVVFSTQKEELRFFAERIENQIQSELEKQRPLAAHFLIFKNWDILERTLKRDLSVVRKEANQSVVKFCNDFSKNLKNSDYFSQRWIESTCRPWGVGPQKKSGAPPVVFVSKFDVDLNVPEVPREAATKFENEITDIMKKSPWYHQNSKAVMAVKINGTLESKMIRRKYNRQAEYSVQVPYKVKSVQAKEAQRPSEGVFALLDIIDLFVGDGESEYDNGDGTVTVIRTEYRAEPREYSYPVVEQKQELALDLKIEMPLNFSPTELLYHNELTQNTFEHNTSFAEANVSPEVAVTLSDTEWLALNRQGIFDVISNGLSEKWQEHFCRTGGSRAAQPTQEAVLRCLHGIGSNRAALVDQWFSKNLGVTPTDLKALLDYKSVALVERR